MYRKYPVVIMTVLALFVFFGCGKSSSDKGSGATGSMAISFTDAPGDYDHVWITVTDVWIHTSDAADPGPQGGGWLKFPLIEPKTVDLLALANGGTQSIWDNIILPVGHYQQIRIVLADTNDALAASATTALNGSTLKYNNEVVINGVEYPLHIPDAQHGIRLAGSFRITVGGTLRLAIDFDANHDIVEFRKGTEYILKPRLSYFNLDNAGAIIGRISTGGTFTTTPRFVVKAEKLSDDGTRHVVRRVTVPDATGKFVLYPVSAVTTETYDIVLRGLDHQTAIIKGVPVMRGTTPTSGATDMGTIPMTPASIPDYTVDGTIASPTGAWVEFEQTLPGMNEAPYQIRFRHFNPMTGTFDSFRLSNDQIQVGTYISSGVTSSLTTTAPQEGVGGFMAIANAVLYDRSAPQPVTSGTTTVAFGNLTVQSPWTGNSVMGSIKMITPPKMNNTMDRGVLFAVHGGMIVNAISVDSQMATGGAYTIMNIPGGSPGNPLVGAFYGIEAVGWSSTDPLAKAVAIPELVDLRTGDDFADVRMKPLW